ncbi:MAG: conjugal transfer protein TraF [Ignavibacteria bacterium]|nr:conjugal transfer protein TraF [Ignavibacteria bacterium]
MIKHISFFLILFNACVFAQFLPGARQSAMGFAFTSIADDHWSIYYNPAGISKVENLSAGVYYSPAPFGLKELAIGSATITKQFSFASIGFAFQSYGFELFRENKISLALAKNFFPEFQFGFKLNYYSLSISNYGSDNSFGVDVGILSSLSENLQLGFAVTNLNRPTYGVNKEKLSQTFSGGISYKPVKNLILALELEKEVRFPFNFKTGIEYSLIKYLALRFGFNTEPNNYTGGIGINYSNFQFNYSFISNNYLGLTHNFGIDFKL